MAEDEGSVWADVQPVDWVYLSEGATHAVFRYCGHSPRLEGLVLRLALTHPTASSNESTIQLRTLFASLFGDELVPRMLYGRVPAAVAVALLQAAEDAHRRPAKRLSVHAVARLQLRWLAAESVREASQVGCDGVLAQLMRDGTRTAVPVASAMSIELKVPVHPVCQCASASGLDRRCPRVVCDWIVTRLCPGQPKCGILPVSPFLVHSVPVQPKHLTCRFGLHQVLKQRLGDISAADASGYCPVALFSGQPDRYE